MYVYVHIYTISCRLMYVYIDAVIHREICTCYLQVVAIKGEPFLSGMHPSAASLCKVLAQKDLRLLEVLSPR